MVVFTMFPFQAHTESLLLFLNPLFSVAMTNIKILYYDFFIIFIVRLYNCTTSLSLCYFRIPMYHVVCFISVAFAL